MKLAIDIGNTSITVGLFKGNKLFKNSHFNSIEKFGNFLDNIKQYDIKYAIISSVAPKLTKDYSNLLKVRYNLSL